jgi:WD40 repeat protein
VNTIALSPNQSILISGDQNGFVKVWDLEAAEPAKEEHLPLSDVPIRSISIVSSTVLDNVFAFENYTRLLMLL